MVTFNDGWLRLDRSVDATQISCGLALPSRKQTIAPEATQRRGRPTGRGEVASVSLFQALPGPGGLDRGGESSLALAVAAVSVARSKQLRRPLPLLPPAPHIKGSLYLAAAAVEV